MKIKSTIYKWFALLLLNQCFLAELNAASAAYCSPTFSNGCFSWSNQTITLDSINWTLGSTSCSLYDYTSLSTTLTAGASYPMIVTNANWCGCAVWIDFNNDQVFDSTENLYYKYGNASSYTYNFNITIPSAVNAGAYRMRVVAGWGSDCFTVSANGYGPCGSYQYGNFDDFTINIINSSVGIDNIPGGNISSIEVFPNPAVTSLTVLIDNYSGSESLLHLLDITGNIIRSIPMRNEKVKIDISDLSKGIYVLRYSDGILSESIRLIK